MPRHGWKQVRQAWQKGICIEVFRSSWEIIYPKGGKRQVYTLGPGRKLLSLQEGRGLAEQRLVVFFPLNFSLDIVS